jgi:hypothetical protein
LGQDIAEFSKHFQYVVYYFLAQGIPPLLEDTYFSSKRMIGQTCVVGWK